MGRYTLYKYISRLMAVLMVLALVAGAAPSALADGESGTIGDNLSWSLSAGVLTITGSGEMADIPELERAPWHELRNEIYQVVLPEGLTSIGDLAFYECGKLQSVVIPNSVTRIGSFTFAYCSDLKVLNLGTGVTAIEECAFTDCYDLVSLQLPGSLKTIGKKAFYRSESIPAVTVPSSVTSLGVAAFGYCASMIRADLQASITELPTLLFYGCARLASVKLPDSIQTVGYHAFRDCDTLETVYYNGGAKTPEEIERIIAEDLAKPDEGENTPGEVTPGENTPGGDTPGENTLGFTPVINVVTDDIPDVEDSDDIRLNPDGTLTQENTTVYTQENTTVSATVIHTHPLDSLSGETTADITVTITGESGWKESTGAVDEALKNVQDLAASTGSEPKTPHITIYVKDSNEIDQEFVDNLTGRDVTVTVITQDGSQWQFNGTDLDSETDSEGYDLRYEVTPGDPELCQELGTDRCFVVKFLASAQVNAEVLIRLDPALSLQNATLFQRDKELKRIQSSVVDHDGFAHFYLASVNDRTDYYVAMNLPDAQQEAIIPEELHEDYGTPEFVEPIKYEVTGRTSSWGMDIKQVTFILAGGMLGAVIIIGVVMFVLNKRKLKKGYIPDIGDDEDEEQ